MDDSSSSLCRLHLAVPVFCFIRKRRFYRLHLAGSSPVDLGLFTLKKSESTFLLLRSLCFFTIVFLTYSSAAQVKFVFGNPTTYAVPSRPATIAVGDLDGDGKPDILIVNNTCSFDAPNSGSLTVLLNNSNGTFKAKSSYYFDQCPWSAAIGDVNNDGKQDIVSCGNFTGDVVVLLGNGDGTFGSRVRSNILAPPYTQLGYLYPQAVALGDLNGDGSLDVAVVNENGYFNTNGLTVSFGNGTGSFNSPTNYTSVLSRSVVIADFNHDGKPDLAAAGQFGPGNTNISVLLNNGNGTFGTTVDYPTGGSASESIVVGDFNGDGHPDLATANNDSQSMSIFLGQGDGSFSNAVIYTVSDAPRGIAAADLDNDAKIDLVLSTYGGNIIIFKGNGDGTFTGLDPLPVSGISFSVATADFDGNGTSDIAKVNLFDGSFDGSLKVLLNYTLPKMAITRVSNQITLSWPRVMGCLVERSTNLLSGAWQSAADNVVSFNNRTYLTNSIGSNALFFRLRMPFGTNN